MVTNSEQTTLDFLNLSENAIHTYFEPMCKSIGPGECSSQYHELLGVGWYAGSYPGGVRDFTHTSRLALRPTQPSV